MVELRGSLVKITTFQWYILFSEYPQNQMVNCICTHKLLTDQEDITQASIKLHTAMNMTYYSSHIHVKVMQNHQQIPTHYLCFRFSWQRQAAFFPQTLVINVFEYISSYEHVTITRFILTYFAQFDSNLLDFRKAIAPFKACVWRTNTTEKYLIN